MAKLTTKERKRLPGKEFALKGGRYPINDANHARNALARAAQHASPSERKTIERKVHAKFPSIGRKSEKYHPHDAVAHHEHGSW